MHILPSIELIINPKWQTIISEEVINMQYMRDRLWYQKVTNQVSLLEQIHLFRVFQHLNITWYEGIDGKEDSCQLLIKRVNCHLNRDEVEEMEDQGMSDFNKLYEFIKGLIPEDQPLAVGALKATPSPNSLVTLSQREFKIAGQIGEPGHWDQMSKQVSS